MPKSSSHSVRHDAVPRDQVLAAARAWAAHLRRDHPEIVRIGYFGSYARGDYVPGSDLDVLIEVTAICGVPSGADMRPADRATRYRPESFPVGMDVFVYTSAELAAQRAAGTGFVKTIDREVCWLAEETSVR
jgi:hypothetical protein